jgi:cytochrome c biogenesis protein CcdA
MSRPWLIVVGIYLVIMAIAGFGSEAIPNWEGWINIIVGIVSLVVGFMDRGRKSSGA